MVLTTGTITTAVYSLFQITVEIYSYK